MCSTNSRNGFILIMAKMNVNKMTMPTVDILGKMKFSVSQIMYCPESEGELVQLILIFSFVQLLTLYCKVGE